MEITKKLEGDTLTLSIKGEINSTNYQDLEEVITENIGGVKTLIFDFKDVEYISSAGLRLLLISRKKMVANGKMIVRNVADTIMDIFSLTGFLDLLDIE